MGKAKSICGVVNYRNYFTGKSLKFKFLIRCNVNELMSLFKFSVGKGTMKKFVTIFDPRRVSMHERCWCQHENTRLNQNV